MAFDWVRQRCCIRLLYSTTRERQHRLTMGRPNPPPQPHGSVSRRFELPQTRCHLDVPNDEQEIPRVQTLLNLAY
ncbi:hypothetical protein GCM10022224_071540 [Nonomuraea antimicrobica]|uniref:Uncharacterized protein n=1 Tax=Nonomuraea antimicrobica TaxID=561173 RepID=A0ABP7CXT0_9ACTN